MAKLSIIVPIYNVEKYLRECLNSIVSQALKDIEIICVNDGSNDSSANILEEYRRKDKRIKVIHKSNSGYGHSMNVGLDSATGEYIGIVESDDFVKTNMFEELYNIAIKNDADIVKSDFYCYTASKNESRKAGKISRFLANRVINAKTYPRLLKMQPSIWSAIYKREFLNSNGIRFVETAGASYQDTSFAFKVMALAERIVLTDKAYLYYRQDNENSSVHSKGKVFMICKEYDEITNFLNENLEIKQFANTTKLLMQYGTYIWNLKRIDEQFIDSFIDVFSDTFRQYYDAGEIGKGFYKKYSKKELQTLINDKQQFRTIIDRVIKHGEKKAQRRKLFSVHINSSRISVVLFGKQIVEIG